MTILQELEQELLEAKKKEAISGEKYLNAVDKNAKQRFYEDYLRDQGYVNGLMEALFIVKGN